ncbi:agmatine deiminase family protein [Methanoregula sp.]|uniref:agmatine deiminase family protein n=1 Tax=Methanoregula sp. TaxID=2052170 RepID=UPI00236954A7|nr:agmatine deiminase family protein [Methanoregula sp.]MDD1685857.1 agmatine deiminase family protein [Methanoregula sp.]
MDLGDVAVGLIQMAMGPDPDENIKKACRNAEAAARDGAQIICLPELYYTRYFPQHPGTDASPLAESIPGRSTGIFSAFAREHQVVIIVPVFERAADGKYYNAAVVIDADGSISEPYRKVHIPQDPGFFEKGYFYPGNGYRVFSTRYGRIAVLICFDQWFPEAARCVALDGAEILFYPTAIGHPGPVEPEEGNWQDAWELIQRSHAIANSVHVAAVNRAGTEGTTRFFGGSFVADAFGKVLARAGDGEETLIVKVDLSMNADVQDFWGFFRNRRPETYSRIGVPFPGNNGIFPDLRQGDTPRNRGFHMPAEWEPHEAVWISWPNNARTFPDIPGVEQAYYAFIEHIHTSEHVEVFVPSAVIHRKVRSKLREMGVDLERVTLHTNEYSDVWIRDYGPTFVVSRALKKIAMVRWNFNAWGNKYEDQLRDGKIPAMMNRRLNMPMFEPGIVLEGGSIDTNGRGTVLTTRACLLNPNRNPDLSADEIEERLREYLGIEKVIWLNDGVVGDDTDGHVDDIARFVGPSTVVCGYESDITDANYSALHDNYEILRQSADQEGKPLTVVKLPMPGKVVDNDGERYPASYTNFYIGNTIVIVPVFSDPNDSVALEILEGLFPGRTVVGINARALVEGYGTFHCATQQQPRL